MNNKANQTKKVIVYSTFHEKEVEGVIVGKEPNGAYRVDIGDYILVKHGEDLKKI